MSMPQAVRHINAMRALDAIFHDGPMSRASLARALNLTRSTTSSIVAELINAELVAEDAEPEQSEGAPRSGRPGTLVRLNAARSTFIGANLSVGQITAVAIDLEAHVVATSDQTFSLEDSSPETVIKLLLNAIAKLIRRLPRSDNVTGLCVTVPGIVDASGTVVRLPILGWRDVALLAKLRSRFPKIQSMLVENDANAFAMAEQYLSRSEVPNEVVCIFMDAGVGGAFMIGRQLQRGSHGYAGEIGHIVLGDRGFLDDSPLPGSVESFIGREAILARHRVHGGVAATFSEFLQRVESETDAAQATLYDWASVFGRTLAALTAVFDPTEIVIGGPVSALFDSAQQPLEASLRRHLIAGQPVPALRRSKVGAQGPALGGAFMLHRQLMKVNEQFVFGDVTALIS